jgi:hypothetical protein
LKESPVFDRAFFLGEVLMSALILDLLILFWSRGFGHHPGEGDTGVIVDGEGLWCLLAHRFNWRRASS